MIILPVIFVVRQKGDRRPPFFFPQLVRSPRIDKSLILITDILYIKRPLKISATSLLED